MVRLRLHQFAAVGAYTAQPDHFATLWPVRQGVVAGVLLDKMPAAMRKDVDAAIGELPPGKTQPSRWTRREAAERAAREGEAQPMDVDGGEGGEAAGAPAAAAEEEQVRATVACVCGGGLLGELAGCSACTKLLRFSVAHAVMVACCLVAGLCIGRIYAAVACYRGARPLL